MPQGAPSARRVKGSYLREKFLIGFGKLGSGNFGDWVGKLRETSGTWVRETGFAKRGPSLYPFSPAGNLKEIAIPIWDSFRKLK